MCVCVRAPRQHSPEKNIMAHHAGRERGDEKRAFFLFSPSLYTRPDRVMMPFVTVEITERDILAVCLFFFFPPALSLSLCIFFTAPLLFIFLYFFSAFEKKKKKTGIKIFTIRVRVYLVLPPAKREEGRVAVLGRGKMSHLRVIFDGKHVLFAR